MVFYFNKVSTCAPRSNNTWRRHTVFNILIQSPLDPNLHPSWIRPILRMYLRWLKQRLYSQLPTSSHDLPSQRILHRHLHPYPSALLPTPVLVKVNRVHALEILEIRIIYRSMELRTISISADFRGRRVGSRGYLRGVYERG